MSVTLLEEKHLVGSPHQIPDRYQYHGKEVKMVELVLTFILKAIELGLGYYLVHSIFSKKTKDFHLSANQCGIEVDSSFYKE